MSIKQFNGEWVSREDRVLFRFNTHDDQEFSFWLTRCVLKGLLEGATKLDVQALEKVHTPQVAQVVQSFQQESVAQQLNFNETFQSAKQKPMGQDPMLVTGLHLNHQGEEVTLKLDLISGQSVQMQMTREILQVMLALLDKLQGIAQWGVGLETDIEPVMPAQNGPRVVH